MSSPLNFAIPPFEFKIGNNDYSNNIADFNLKWTPLDLQIPITATLEFSTKLLISDTDVNKLNPRYNPDFAKRTGLITLKIRGILVFSGYLKSYKWDGYSKKPTGKGTVISSVEILDYDLPAKNIPITVGTGTGTGGVVGTLISKAINGATASSSYSVASSSYSMPSISYSVPSLTGSVTVPIVSDNPIKDAQKYAQADLYMMWAKPDSSIGFWKFTDRVEPVFIVDINNCDICKPDQTLIDYEVDEIIVSGGHDYAKVNSDYVAPTTVPADPEITRTMGWTKSLIPTIEGESQYLEVKREESYCSEAEAAGIMPGAYDGRFISAVRVWEMTGAKVQQEPSWFTDSIRKFFYPVSIEVKTTTQTKIWQAKYIQDPTTLIWGGGVGSPSVDYSLIESQMVEKISPAPPPKEKDSPATQNTPYVADTQTFTGHIILNQQNIPYLRQVRKIDFPYLYNQDQCWAVGHHYAQLFGWEANAYHVEMPLQDAWLNGLDANGLQGCKLSDMTGYISAPEIRVDGRQCRFIFTFLPYFWRDVMGDDRPVNSSVVLSWLTSPVEYGGDYSMSMFSTDIPVAADLWLTSPVESGGDCSRSILTINNSGG